MRSVAGPGQPSTFSRRLRQARERAGLTQYELGLRAGLDENVAGPRINQYENGIHEPRQDMVKELAKALGIPAAYLYATDEDLARLLLSWPGLTPAKRKKYADSAEADAAKATGRPAKAEPSEPAQKPAARRKRKP